MVMPITVAPVRNRVIFTSWYCCSSVRGVTRPGTDRPRVMENSMASRETKKATIRRVPRSMMATLNSPTR